jgi:hypothetical protein
MLFTVNRAWFDGNNTNNIHIVREIEYGCLEKSPLNGVLSLCRVGADRKLDVHALRTPRAREKRFCGGRYGLLFEHLGCGTKTIS